MKPIQIQGAREGNLKNLSLEIPKQQLVVLTGRSGSGKTTLAKDVLYQECQRQYLEAMAYQGIRKPRLDRLRNASPAILIAQGSGSRNPRSSVGTATDLYTDLRMLFEKLSQRTCPHCGREIAAFQCPEEVEKKDGDFQVFQYCSHCGHRMEKLTRTFFSYNTREGACPTCQGFGTVRTLEEAAVLHSELSLEEGAVDYWAQKYRDYQIDLFRRALACYGVPVEAGTPVADYTPEQRAILLYGVESAQVKALFPAVAPPKMTAAGKFEGVYTILWRRLSEKGGDTGAFKGYFRDGVCPECGGERLNALSREVTVHGTRLPQLVKLSLRDLLRWVDALELGEAELPLVQSYVTDLRTKLRRLLSVGLGYLTLDRQTGTLSGGEGQRIRLAAALDADITGILYILDEPTVGLHPKDTDGMIRLLKDLRDFENTVLVIEHDPDVMRAADYLIDLGPGAGKYGGEVVGTGTLEELLRQECSVTGRCLRGLERSFSPPRPRHSGWLTVEGATLHNLRRLSVRFPVGCLTCVTGVSGSGKSTLVFDVLAGGLGGAQVAGLGQFDALVAVEQAPPVRQSRSNVATYAGLYTEIRDLFAAQAAQKKLPARYFSFNTPGGRCENCQGLGYVTSNMLFFEDVDVPCPVCGGRQFSQEVLSVTYRGLNVKEVLQLPVDDALELFSDRPRLAERLRLLKEVGLGYLELGQALPTLSGGEAQRLKLAKELLENRGKRNLYLIDEPTTGLHPLDVEQFLVLLQRMVDGGNTVIVVEHNLQLIAAADWVIDLGPGGGEEGGRVIAQGTPEELSRNPRSVTGAFLQNPANSLYFS